MRLAAYLRDEFVGKRIVVVGNAGCGEDCSSFVDDHEVVVRINFFANFESGNCGQRLTHWCVNPNIHKLKTRAQCDRRAELAKSLSVPTITPYHHRWTTRRRMRSAVDYYLGHGLRFISPDREVIGPADEWIPIGIQPSTGIYLARHLVEQNIRFSAIGFTGDVSAYHTPEFERKFIRSHPLIDFHQT